MPEFVAIKRDVIAGYFGRTHRAYLPVYQYITFLPQTNTFVYLSFVLNALPPFTLPTYLYLLLLPRYRYRSLPQANTFRLSLICPSYLSLSLSLFF